MGIAGAFELSMLAALVVAVAGFWQLYGRVRRRRLGVRLRERWGKTPARVHRIDRALLLHEVTPGPDPDAYEIDPATWADLDMDLVFGAVDRTQTALGAQHLYRSLRRPRLSAATLEGRERLIERFTSDPAARETVQAATCRLCSTVRCRRPPSRPRSSRCSAGWRRSRWPLPSSGRPPSSPRWRWSSSTS
jgi:hypothetical protein